MNVTSILTKDYENKPPSSPKKTNPIKPNTNPTCRGVASGEAGSNPTCSELACPVYPEQSRRELACGELACTEQGRSVEPVEGVEPISNRIRKKEILTGVDKLCQIMDNETGIVHSPEAGRETDAFACKTK